MNKGNAEINQVWETNVAYLMVWFLRHPPTKNFKFKKKKITRQAFLWSGKGYTPCWKLQPCNSFCLSHKITLSEGIFLIIPPFKIQVEILQLRANISWFLFKIKNTVVFFFSFPAKTSIVENCFNATGTNTWWDHRPGSNSTCNCCSPVYLFTFCIPPSWEK